MINESDSNEHNNNSNSESAKNPIRNVHKYVGGVDGNADVYESESENRAEKSGDSGYGWVEERKQQDRAGQGREAELLIDTARFGLTLMVVDY